MSIFDQIANPPQVNIMNYAVGEQQFKQKQFEALRTDALVLKNKESRELLDILTQTKTSRIKKENALSQFAVNKAKREQDFQRKYDIASALGNVKTQEEYDAVLNSFKQRVAPGMMPEEFTKGFLEPHGLTEKYDQKSITSLEDSLIRDIDMRRFEHKELFKHQLDLQLAGLKAAAKAAGKEYDPKSPLGKLFFDYEQSITEGNQTKAYLLGRRIETEIGGRDTDARAKEQAEIDRTLSNLYSSIATFNIEDGTAQVQGDTERATVDFASTQDMRASYEDTLKKHNYDHNAAAREHWLKWKEVRDEPFEPTNILPGGNPVEARNFNPFLPDTIYFVRRSKKEQEAFMNKYKEGAPIGAPNIVDRTTTELQQLFELTQQADDDDLPGNVYRAGRKVPQ